MGAILRKDKDILRILRGKYNLYSLQHARENLSMALSALWYLGKENVYAEVVRRIREGLSEEAFEKLCVSNMPAWIASAIDQYGRELAGSGPDSRV